MARPLYASFLPTIKCSNCSAEIEISAMGDHLCGGAATTNGMHSQMGRTDHDRIPPATLMPPQHLGVHSGLDRRKPNPSLLAPGSKNAANAQGLPFEKPSPPERYPLTSAFSAGAVPTIKGFEPEPAGFLAQRSSTQPVPTVGSLNPHISPHNTSETTLRPGNSISRPNAPEKLDIGARSYSESTPVTPNSPLSPGALNGVNLLKRMDSIAPGPFNSRSTSRRYAERNGPRSPGLAPAPSIAEAVDLSGTPSTNGQPLTQPPRPETSESLLGQPQALPNGEALEGTQAGNQNPARSFSFDDTSENKPIPDSAESEEKPKETVAPLQNFSQARRSHSLTDSESSAISQSVSDSRTISSRSSSSPISTSTDLQRKSSIEPRYSIEPIQTQHASLNAVLVDATSPASDVSPLSPVAEVMASDETTAQNAHNFGGQEGSVKDAVKGQSLSSGLATSPPPAAQDFPESEVRLSSLRYDPNVSNGRASGPISMMPRPEDAKKRVRSVAPKGNCRGCDKIIIGKSIKAADGRLSGRWHRECFKCHTCETPFQTADFYVLEDQPYCAQHYHELNQSICQHCNMGIEGKYIQTQPSLKYHVDCFVCHDCRKPLTRDYYEMSQHFYCEADAYRVWQKSKMLTPGRRFPEKRQTRIMTPA